jgi:2-keto-4-pentenoate hydratase/2-oxohepta-3-ene-1,7-dioic acid hydratase in catechol pathway
LRSAREATTTRLGIIERKGRRTPALVVDGGALDLVGLAAKDPYPAAQAISHLSSIEGLLKLGPGAMAWLDRVAKEKDAYAAHVVAEPVWRAPMSEPGKICAIGLNYLDHCKEQNVEPPAWPKLFAKFNTAIIGPGDEIVWSPDLTNNVDWEAELAVVIGKTARNVPKAKALDHVAGYLNANDVTARDLQKADGQFVRSKSLDTFCPLGPYFVTREDVRDPHKLRIQCRVNGRLKQDSNTDQLIFGVDHIVSFLSEAFTLLPGDVVLTGTPAGVGAHRDPPEFLRNDDRVEVEIEGLGVLTNRCRTR